MENFNMVAEATEHSSWIKDIVNNIFTQNYWIEIGYKIIEIILIFFVAYVVTKVAKFLLKKLFQVREDSRFSTQRTITLMKLVENVATYILYFLVIATALEAIGIPVTTLLAGAGIFGLAIGFGAQNLVKDVITGFFIILEDQFAVGDYVRIDPIYEGYVEGIGLRTTKIKSSTGEVHILPNGAIPSVTNFSRNNSIAIADIRISSENDIKYVETIIQALLEELPAKYEEMVGVPQLLGVQTFEQNEVILRVTAETKPMMHFMIGRVLRKEIKMRLDQKEIKTLCPQMVLVNDAVGNPQVKQGNMEG